MGDKGDKNAARPPEGSLVETRCLIKGPKSAIVPFPGPRSGPKSRTGPGALSLLLLYKQWPKQRAAARGRFLYLFHPHNVKDRFEVEWLLASAAQPSGWRWCHWKALYSTGPFGPVEAIIRHPHLDSNVSLCAALNFNTAESTQTFYSSSDSTQTFSPEDDLKLKLVENHKKYKQHKSNIPMSHNFCSYIYIYLYWQTWEFC